MLNEMTLWLGFGIIVLIMLAIDLFLIGGKRLRKLSAKEACGWTLFWIAVALIFNVIIWQYYNYSSGRLLANQKAIEFLTGYVVEKALSVDNIFVFLLIFNYFQVPAAYQRRVLVYGVLGAIIMRVLLILGGAWLVEHYHWVLYLFGLFLVFTGIKMLWHSETESDLSKNFLLRGLYQCFRVTPEYHQEKFFIKQNSVIYLTPLAVVLVLIEVSDLIFAFDSIPAIFAITTDPFIVITSNIFAIMGLRAMYFLLADMADRFSLLKYGLALVLIFIGGKMLVEKWLHVPIFLSLGIVATIIMASIIISLSVHKQHQTIA